MKPVKRGGIYNGTEKRRNKNIPFTLSLCKRCESDFRNGGYSLVKNDWQEYKTNCDFCGKSNSGLDFEICEMD